MMRLLLRRNIPKVLTLFVVMVLVTSSVVVGVALEHRAWNVPSVSASSQLVAGTGVGLFNADGTINLNNRNNIVSWINASNRTQTFRLFPDGGSGTGLAFSQLNWRIAHITANEVVFISDAAYRNAIFHTVNDATTMFNQSNQVRPLLTNDYNNGVSAAIRDVIGISGWATTHIVTLPSYAEIGGLNETWATNSWGFTNAMRAYNRGAFSNVAWSSQAISGGTGNNAFRRWVHADTGAQLANTWTAASRPMTENHAVRPILRMPRVIFNNHNVTFNTHGGNAVAAQNNLPWGSLATQPATPTHPLGYRFLRWSATQNGATAFNFATTQIRANTTIHAVWQPNEALATPVKTITNGIVTWNAVSNAWAFDIQVNNVTYRIADPNNRMFEPMSSN